MNGSLYDEYLDLISSKTIPKFLPKYLNVPSLIRLKYIGYFCGMDYASKDVYNFKEKILRYDHSLSVALLTWKFTHDKKATIAGLFHDIATPCFSHVIDYMNKDYENQESTEEYTKDVIINDIELVEFLLKDNIFIEDIINFKEYSIADNKRPKLCADRLDGIILTGIAWTKTIDKKDIIEIMSDLDVYENEFGEKELGFKTASIALNILYTSNEIDKYCHSNEDKYMMELLAEITKISIDIGIIKYEELYYADENCIINKIKNSKIKEMENLLDKFENIKKKDIPIIKLANIKKRDLNPLVDGIRLNEVIKIGVQ
ncbi:MAG: HD domain-containing protein [Bacilli bacterium]